MVFVFPIAAVGLFLSSLAFGEIALPGAAVAALLLVNAGLILGHRGFFTRKNMLLALWFILLTHRSFVPRKGLEEGGPLFFLEVGATLAVLFGASVVLLLSVGALRIKISEGRFWLLAYTLLAGVSLLWTPLPFYSGFWFIRLVCVAIIALVYFADASVEDCRKFFLVTLLGSVPVIALPIIGIVSGTSTAQLGAHRISGFWVHPSVASITAFSVAAAALAIMLQRGRSAADKRLYLHAGLFALGCASGFLAAGKTGAIGGAVAISVMLLIGRRFRLWLGVLAVGAIGYLAYLLVLRDMEVGLLVHVQDYNFERLGTVQSRFDLWLAALEAWSGSIHTAFLGRGFTSFRAFHDIATVWGWDPGQAHSSYVNLLVDSGVVGAFFFMVMLIRPAAGAIAMALREGRGFSESPAFPVFIALVSLLTGGLVDDVFGGTLQATTYLLFGTVLALDRLIYLQRATAEDPGAGRTDMRPLPDRGLSLQQRFPAAGE